MRKGRLVKQFVALVLVVCLLPFGDFSQVVAAGSQGINPKEQTGDQKEEYEQNGAKEDKSSVSGNGIKEEQGVVEQASEEKVTDQQQDSIGRLFSGSEINDEEKRAIRENEESFEDTFISLDGRLLNEDTEIGNLYLEDGILDLNGYTLTVYGSLIQSGGELRVSGGNLLIRDDYRIQTVTGTEEPLVYTKSSGSLHMTSAEDWTYVNTLDTKSRKFYAAFLNSSSSFCCGVK